MAILIKRSFYFLGLCVGLLLAYKGYRVKKAFDIVDEKFAFIEQSARIFVEDLTSSQKEILLAIEDPNFYDHNGLDLRSPGAGKTTITQALVKRVFFKNFKPGFAKIEQSLIARYVVNRKVSKVDQITAFLNLAYFGNCNGQQIEGYDEAAKCYLRKSFGELSDDDFINLTARLIAPNKFNRDAPALEIRIKKIERLLIGECVPRNHSDVTYEAC